MPPDDQSHLRAELAHLRAAGNSASNTVSTSPTSATSRQPRAVHDDINPGDAQSAGQTLSIAQRQNTRPFPGWGSIITCRANGAFSRLPRATGPPRTPRDAGPLLPQFVYLVEGDRQLLGLAGERQRERHRAAESAQSGGRSIGLDLRSAFHQCDEHGVATALRQWHRCSGTFPRRSIPAGWRLGIEHGFQCILRTADQHHLQPDFGIPGEHHQRRLPRAPAFTA